jgi:hypothetical protein
MTIDIDQCCAAVCERWECIVWSDADFILPPDRMAAGKIALAVSRLSAKPQDWAPATLDHC